MVSEENRKGLYVAVPIYFCCLALATYWAYHRVEKMKHTGVSDALAAHYLGGRDFGPLLTAGTLFASLFSGYTVVGIPNEAYKSGWQSIRWIPTLMAVVAGFYGTGMRLRKASMIRNHQSPVDFITDRYQSQLLRYVILALQVLPTLIYLAAQVIAIKVTFNSVFELDPDASFPVIIVMIIIVIFEWLGGLNSVALTDAFQAVVMVTSFVILPVVVLRNFGGWKDLDPETYPKPQFYQTLTKESQWGFWQFSLVNFSFFTLPHLIQRTYAAKDLASLRMGYAVMTMGPWFTSFVGIFMGTVGVVILADKDGNPTDHTSPFTAILEEVMSLGGFAKGAGVIAVTASLAAIMSTADSLIIAISQLITVEIVYPMRPNATTTEVTIVGKFVSLMSVVLGLLVGVFWDKGITDLGAIQFGLSAQAVPAFLIGLFAYNKKTDIHPWCISAGAIGATIFVLTYYFRYVKPTVGAMGADSGILGVILQLVIALVLEAGRRLLGGPEAMKEIVQSTPKKNDGMEKVEIEFLYPGRPEWDIPKLARFGEHALTPQLVWKSMEGINEPLANTWWCFMMFFVITMATPLTSELEPGLDTEGLTGNVFLYAPAVINGLPWWAFKAIMMSFVATLLLLIAIMRMPDDFPIDEVKIELEGIDPNLVEMTFEEMNKRFSYDSKNEMISRRRSSITQTMQELGMLDKPESIEFEPTPSQRKLALLALQSSRRLSVDKHMDIVKEDDASSADAEQVQD